MSEVPGEQITQGAAPEVVADRDAVIQNGFHRRHASTDARWWWGEIKLLWMVHVEHL